MAAKLTIQMCCKRFGGLQALNEVSLEVEPGSVTALIGPNGAGKTTMFNCVTGFETPSSGRITLGAERIDHLPPWSIARMGAVRTFQTPIGFPNLSVWENLMVGGASAKSESLLRAAIGRRRWLSDERRVQARVERLLRQVGLWDERDTILGELSPGKTKLVEFSRQLMADPDLLLLDEPASGVDPSQLDNVADLIRRLNRDGLTMLAIDHNLAFVISVADYVYVLAQGAVIAQGTPDEIARDPQVIETYLGGTP